MPKIAILFRPGGKVEFHPQGFDGPACHRATAKLVEALKGMAVVREGEEPLLQRDVEISSTDVQIGEVQA